MKLSIARINSILLTISVGLIIFCLIELIVLDNIYPYALLATMSLLSCSSFLAVSTFKTRLEPLVYKSLFFIALINFFLLLSFTFYPTVLRYLWNISFGIVFLFPMVFILQFVKERVKKIDKIVFYFTISTAILFESSIVFKLNNSLIYHVLTSGFLILTMLLITITIVRSKK